MPVGVNLVFTLLPIRHGNEGEHKVHPYTTMLSGATQN